MPFHFSITQFEGPLDLLLYLIDRAQLDIGDIFVSEITDQYLQSVADLTEIQMESASGFLAMAAHLLEIKSRRLLPGGDENPAEEEDAEQELINQLKEYRKYKMAAEQLRTMEEQGGLIFYKLPDELPVQERLVLTDNSIDILCSAIRNIFQRERLEEELSMRESRRLTRDHFTVPEKMTYIRRCIAARTQMEFTELFSEHPTREEVITTFLALLELIHAEAIQVIQHSPQEAIVMKLGKAVEM